MTVSYTLCSGSVKASNGKVKPSAKVEKPCLPASLEEAVKSKIKLDELRNIIEEVALANCNRIWINLLPCLCRCS